MPNAIAARPEVSVVVPCYNEVETLRTLYVRLQVTLDGTERTWEIVLVDDGSEDGSYSRMREIAMSDPRVRPIPLRGNFGQTPALQAGFDHAKGETVIAMDGDLQHAPEDIPRFLAKIDEGFDVVSGWRERRPEPWFSRRFPSKCANLAMRYLSGVPLRDFGTTYKAYRRDVLKELHLYGEFHRFIPVLAREKGAAIAEIPIRCGPRVAGNSNYGIGRTITVFFDLIRLFFLTRYLSRPLQFFGTLGFTLVGAGIAIETWLVCLKYVAGLGLLEHRAPLFLLGVLLLVVGTQFLTLGLLGEMVVRIYHSSRAGAVYSLRRVPAGATKTVGPVESATPSLQMSPP
ncbi:MAG: glycosyltransferase [Gemmatimonadetes bacterium]|nr:glycosyltransferase [Gemmatimonadota bacterium]